MITDKRPVSHPVDHVGRIFVALFGFIVLFALVSAIARPTPTGPDGTIYLDGSGLYGNFEIVEAAQGTPGGVRGEAIYYDTIWGPLSRNETVMVDGHLYGNCVGEGDKKDSPIPELNEPYPSIFCPLVR
jgi:hypothetical protein